jgi:hypothetical protein
MRLLFAVGEPLVSSDLSLPALCTGVANPYVRGRDVSARGYPGVPGVAAGARKPTDRIPLTGGRPDSCLFSSVGDALVSWY